MNQVAQAAFNLLFMQLAFAAIKDSVNADKDDESYDHEAAFYRIEQLGHQVGQRLVERVLSSRPPPAGRIIEQLDVVKFLCKEFWATAFGKSIDNLKTNHRGVYVLQDQDFRWIARFAIDATCEVTSKMAVLVP